MRVAVVTGGSSGIGAATVRALAREGWTVVAAARRTDRLATLAEEVAAAGGPGRVVPATLDVRDTVSVDALAAAVADAHGRCDLLVCNAGVGGGDLEDRADLDEVLDVLDVDLLGTVRCCAAFADLLARSAPSQVVAVASVAGKLGVGPPGYVAAKFGMVGLAEALDLAWRPRGVAVTQLNPGFVRTEGFPQAWADGTPAARVVAEPDDVAAAVLRVVRSRRRERTVPGWYRAVVVLRHTIAPAWWRIAAATDRPRRRERALRRDRRDRTA